MTDNLVEWTALEQAAAIRSGDLTSVDLVTAHLDRIETLNPSINAIVEMFPRENILTAAEAADATEPIGPLHGLPVAVKDLQDVAGLTTRSGSVTTSTSPKPADGHVAAKLRAAGAIIVGKTNTPEFGTGSHTFNEVYGLTHNPWNLERSAGGSSGGAAAALASRMLPIADGSDLGGSLRNPAGFCNVVGMRPSIGVVANPNSRSSHLIRLGLEGPMGRTVADTALVLSALAGQHPGDPLSLPIDPRHFSNPLPTGTGARLAWAGDLDLFTCEPEVLDICRTAAQRIVDVGGSFAEERPDLSTSMRIFRVLRGLAYRDLHSQLPSASVARTKATVQENMQFGLSIDVDDVVDAEISRATLHRQMADFFDRYDVLALPTAQVAPFPAELEYPTEIDGKPMDDYLEWMTACCVITPTGCPAISIPAGFTSDGLPVGLQLVARLGADRQLLEIAAAIEQPALSARTPPSSPS